MIPTTASMNRKRFGEGFQPGMTILKTNRKKTFTGRVATIELPSLSRPPAAAVLLLRANQATGINRMNAHAEWPDSVQERTTANDWLTLATVEINAKICAVAAGQSVVQARSPSLKSLPRDHQCDRALKRPHLLLASRLEVSLRIVKEPKAKVPSSRRRGTRASPAQTVVPCPEIDRTRTVDLMRIAKLPQTANQPQTAKLHQTVDRPQTADKHHAVPVPATTAPVSTTELIR